MKVRTILSATLSLAALNANAQRIKGSDTVLPVIQQTVERFMNREPDIRVTVIGGGTGVGTSALLDSTINTAMASRPTKFSEKVKAKAVKRDIDEVIVIYDTLIAVVHPSNPARRPTCRQLEDISRGKITGWRQVGGGDRKIVVYSRKTSSGTYGLFKEDVLKNKNYMNSSLSMPAAEAIIQSADQTKGVIGYVGLAYMSPRIKALSASYDGEHCAGPAIENATSKTCPTTRPFYYYYDVKNKV